MGYSRTFLPLLAAIVLGGTATVPALALESDELTIAIGHWCCRSRCVLKIHIRDDALTPDGRLDIPRIKPLARLGYFNYTDVDKEFEMRPPGDDPRRLKGLAGDRVR
jgi:hypothetical protein